MRFRIWLLLAFSAPFVVNAADDWPVYGGDPGGQRYSTLSQINRDKKTSADHNVALAA